MRKSAESVDRTRDLKIFSLTLSQLSYFGLNISDSNYFLPFYFLCIFFEQNERFLPSSSPLWTTIETGRSVH